MAVNPRTASPFGIEDFPGDACARQAAQQRGQRDLQLGAGEGLAEALVDAFSAALMVIVCG